MIVISCRLSVCMCVCKHTYVCCACACARVRKWRDALTTDHWWGAALVTCHMVWYLQKDNCSMTTIPWGATLSLSGFFSSLSIFFPFSDTLSLSCFHFSVFLTFSTPSPSCTSINSEQYWLTQHDPPRCPVRLCKHINFSYILHQLHFSIFWQWQ